MNRIYRSVWNEISRTFVAAAETVRGRGKPASACVDGTPAARRPVLARRRPMMLALEQRFMFDGAAAAPVAEAAAAAVAAEAHAAVVNAIPDAPAPVEVRAADPAKDGGKKEVVFVDTSVADYKTLEAGIRDGVAIVEIDGSKDGLAQIAKWAEANSGYDSISILGHGSQATLNLGTTTLTSASLSSATVRTELAEIGQALTADGDLMLYGCDVAKGSEGEAFIADLAKATGADVAASSDTTGAQAKGGDWALEKASGAIDAESLALTDYQSVLSEISFLASDAAFQDLNTTSITKTVDGSNKTITFSAADGQTLTGGYDDNMAFGFSSYGINSTGSYVKITAPTGYTFDLKSFAATVSQGYLSIAVTDGNGYIHRFTHSGSGTALSIQSGFESINDVAAVEISSSGIDWFNNFFIDDVKAPPSFSAQYSHSFYDTEVANSFTNVSGTLTATPVSSAYIAAYGISGTTAGGTEIGGTYYDISQAGTYGTLYVRSGSGAYVYVPNSVEIEKISTAVLQEYPYNDTKADLFTVTATDGAGATATNVVRITLNGQNDTPEITSGASASVAENSSGAVYTATASDRDSGQTLTYSLSGADKDLFNINPSTGEVSFKTDPNYENPVDSGHDNVYDIEVTATDNAAIVPATPVPNDSAPKAVQITVTDADEAPVFSSAATGSVAENGAAGEVVYTAVATDPEHGAVTYSVSGTDAAAFTIDATSGQLKINAAADYETKSSYSIRIEASDGNLVGTQDVTIAVSEVNDKPVITAPATQNVDQGKPTPITGISVSDPDAGNDPITVELSASAGTFTATDISGVHVGNSGTDAITLNGSRASLNEFIAAGNIGYTSAAGATGDVTVRIYADDIRPNGSADTRTLTLKIIEPNAAPVLADGSPALTPITEKDTGNAGQTVASFVGASISDTNSGALQGIAITALASGNGVWQYRTDAGAAWTDVGAVAGDSALLLRATDTIRFVPNGIAGTAASITYRAWDQTSGTAGGRADTTTHGGETAFSTATDSASIAVSDVNDAPTAVAISNATISTLDSADTAVGTLSTTDVDGTSWTYSIVSVDGDTDPMSTSVFKISSSTLVATLPSSLTPTTHRVVVRATDSGGASYDQELNIKVDSALIVTTATDEAYVSGETLTAAKGGTGLSLKEAIGFANEHTSATTIRFADGLGLLAGDVALTRTLTLDFGGASATLSGAISVASGATLIVKNDAGSVTLSGIVSGAGSLDKQGAGTLTLSGANTYTGQTTVESGTLSTSGANQLADTSNVEVRSGATFALGGNETVATLAGAGTVSLGANTLTVNTVSDTTFSGALSGTGGLTKTGSGTLRLSGANSYTGATIVDSGTLAISGGAALADTTAVSVASYANLYLYAAESIGSLSGAGSVALGIWTLTVGGDNASTNFSGAITGDGSLAKTGSGTLTLTGDNRYSGTTRVDGGTLAIASGGTLGYGEVTLATATTLAVGGTTTLGSYITLAGRATIETDATLTLAGFISGAGDLVKTGSGTLALAQANSYSGATFVNGGTLSIASDASLGTGALTFADGTALSVTSSSVTAIGHAVTLNGEVTLFSSDRLLQMDGAISGDGSLLISCGPSGAVKLAGSNSYRGTTTVSDGTLQIDGDGNLGGGALTLAGGTLSISGATTIDNAITLAGDARIVNAEAVMLSAAVSGNYALTKDGSGTLTLAADSDYGTTTLLRGALLVNATVNSDISANSGTRVGGSGSVAGTLTIASGATLAPGDAGNGVGTLAVSGALTLGGTLAVDLASDSSYDRVSASSVAYGANSAISVTRVGGYTRGGSVSYTLVSATPSGTLNGIAANAEISRGGDSYTVGYTGGLTLAGVPLPSVTGVTATADGAYKAGDNVTISVNFDRAVNVSGSPTLTLSDGGTAIYTGGNGGTALTFTYTVQAGENSADLDYASAIALSLNGGAIVDQATGLAAARTLVTPGTAGSLAANNAIVIDTAAPTATIVLSDQSLRIGETAMVTITFSEAVSGFTNADLTIANGTLSVVSSSDGGITWTATFTPSANVTDASNLITLAGVADAVGNAGAGVTSSANYAVDTQRPIATIVVADSVLAAGETSLVTITFSEAVSGFTNDDLTVASGTLSAVSSTDGGVTWTAMLTPTAGIKAASNLISLNNGGVVDLAGNAGSGMSDSNNYAVSTVRPTATIVVADSALKAGETSLVTITFSAAVSGFTNDDLTVANGSLSAVTSTDGGITWSATFTPNANVTDSSNVITLDTAGVTDLAGSAGSGTSDSNNYAIDSVRPTATIVLADPSLTIGETTQVTITFSEAVSGFDASDLTVANGSLSALTTSDNITWSATFTPNAEVSDASNVITLNDHSVENGAGNSNSGAATSANYAVLTARTLSYSATTLAESAANDGSISTTVIITLANESFSGADGGALGTVANVPAGLTAQLIKVDATHARLTLSGKASAHANAQDIGNLMVSFADGDFVGSPAAKVAGATTTLAIDFADAAAVPPPPVVAPVVPAPVVVTPPIVLEPPVVVLPPASVTPPASVVAAAPPAPATPDPVVDTVQFIAPASPLALAASPQADSSQASLTAPQLAAAAVAPAEAARAPLALASTSEGSSPAPAMTQGGGFQVVVASGAVSPTDGLVVNRGVADQSVGSGTVSQFAIPADAFAASSAGAVVTLSAQQSNGAPLPSWVRFDAASGRFEGQPPAGFTGELTIRVVARDAQGHEAVTTFKIKVGDKSARTQPERPGRAGLTEQLRLIGRPHPALERLARLAAWRNAA